MGDRNFVIVDKKYKFITSRQIPKMQLISPSFSNEDDALYLDAPGMPRLRVPTIDDLEDSGQLFLGKYALNGLIALLLVHMVMFFCLLHKNSLTEPLFLSTTSLHSRTEHDVEVWKQAINSAIIDDESVSTWLQEYLGVEWYVVYPSSLFLLTTYCSSPIPFLSNSSLIFSLFKISPTASSLPSFRMERPIAS